MFIVLPLLGVFFWLMVGLVAGALWSRHQVAKAPGAFPCKVRKVSGNFQGIPEAWSLLASHGMWAREVLIVTQGVAGFRVNALPITGVERAPGVTGAGDVKRLGEDPVSAVFRLADGSLVEIAVPGEWPWLMLGPFAASVLRRGFSAPPATRRRQMLVPLQRRIEPQCRNEHPLPPLQRFRPT